MMEAYSGTKIRPYELMLKGREFNFIIEKQFTPKAVLEKLLRPGARMTFSIPQYGSSVHCKIGNNLVAFAQRYRYEWLATQLDMGRQLHGVITTASGKLPNRIVFVTVSCSSDESSVVITLPESPKTATTESTEKARKSTTPHGSAKPQIIAKHPLTGVGFYPHKNFLGSCNREVGKSGIYCIYNKDFKTYIGQSLNIAGRWRTHVQMLNSGRHHNPQLQSDWSVLGDSGFVFKVVQYSSEEYLDSLEEHYILKMKCFGNVYNATEDGQGKVPQNLFENCASSSYLPDKTSDTGCIAKPQQNNTQASNVQCNDACLDDSFEKAIENIVMEELPYKPVVDARPHLVKKYKGEWSSGHTNDLSEFRHGNDNLGRLVKRQLKSEIIVSKDIPKVIKREIFWLKIGAWFSFRCYEKLKVLEKRYAIKSNNF